MEFIPDQQCAFAGMTVWGGNDGCGGGNDGGWGMERPRLGENHGVCSVLGSVIYGRNKAATEEYVAKATNRPTTHGTNPQSPPS